MQYSREYFHFLLYIFCCSGKSYENGGAQMVYGLTREMFLIVRAFLLQDNWLPLAAPFIHDRIEQYAKNEIRFNLMAVIQNRCQVFEEQLREQEVLKERLTSSKSAEGTAPMDVDGSSAPHVDVEYRVMQVEGEIMR